MITAHAVFKCGGELVTCYSNLGIDGLCFIVNEGELEILVLDSSSLHLGKELIEKCKTLKTLIVTGTKIDFKCDEIEVEYFQDLIDFGKSLKEEILFEKVVSEQIAVIMYTSGTTGNPKGILIHFFVFFLIIFSFL